jgi:hypothetical protein
MRKLATHLIILKSEPTPLQMFKYVLQEITSWKFTNNILYIWYIYVYICNTDLNAASEFIGQITTQSMLSCKCNSYCSVYSCWYATIVRWTVISHLFLGNSSVNMFQWQQLRMQWGKRCCLRGPRWWVKKKRTGANRSWALQGRLRR